MNALDLGVNLFVALFALVDPIGNIPIFAAATAGASREEELIGHARQGTVTRLLRPSSASLPLRGGEEAGGPQAPAPAPRAAPGGGQAADVPALGAQGDQSMRTPRPASGHAPALPVPPQPTLGESTPELPGPNH